MWAVKWFLAAVLMLIILGFALQNSGQEVNVVFLTGSWEVQSVQMWLVIYASFGLGVLFWLAVSIFQVMDLKKEIRKMNKEQRELQSELDSLRNLSLGDDESGFGLAPGES